MLLVLEDDGWVAYFLHRPLGRGWLEVLLAVADRAAVEQDYHDVKEVHGAGQQQLRHYWANVAAFHLNLWGAHVGGTVGVAARGGSAARSEGTARGTTRSDGFFARRPLQRPEAVRGCGKNFGACGRAGCAR